MSKKIFNKGINKDSSKLNQPKGTYRFALNAVNNSEGKEFIISNEESNKACINLPSGYTPLGEVSISNDEKVLFLVNPSTNISMIGIVDSKCNFTKVIDDANAKDKYKLNFKITNQIKAVYRLRQGCGRTVYWVDGQNPPMVFNIDKVENYLTDGMADRRKFYLQKTFSIVPIFSNLKVLNSGGNLKPGSVNVGIRFLDNDLNPTEWITFSQPLNIYNDSINANYTDVRGSISSDEELLNFPNTTKSIEVTVDNLDSSYPYYQLAFVHANSGNGLISDIYYSDIIPVTNNTFTYTGNNYKFTGTEDEIAQFTNIIDEAKTIEQLENRLLLGNVSGKKLDFCKLQSYASKINADAYIKRVYLNTLTDVNNPKHSEVQLNGVGYQPGEIYSFGIVYVFEDGSTSPVYHIPGKSNNIMDGGENISNNIVFAPGENTYPMSSNNISTDTLYIDNSICTDYWGYDSIGNKLKNTPVRHHRFPYRKDISIPFVEEVETGEEDYYFNLQVSVAADVDLSCLDDNSCENFYLKVTYTVDGVEEIYLEEVLKSAISLPFNKVISLPKYSTNNLEVISVEAVDSDGNADNTISNLTFNYTIEASTVSNINTLYVGYTFGIKFSNIELPDIDNNKIIGYYIVRQERTENEKTVLDSGILLPSIRYRKEIDPGDTFTIWPWEIKEEDDEYIASGLLAPNMNYRDWEIQEGKDNSFQYNNEDINKERLSKNVFGFVHPMYKFKDREYQDLTKIRQVGEYNITKQSFSKFKYNDVMEGSSYDSEHMDDDYEDKDGWTLKCITRDSYIKYNNTSSGSYNLSTDDIDDIFYLKEATSKTRTVNQKQTDIYNIAADNSVGIIITKNDIEDRLDGKYPYVYLERDLINNYTNFRTEPYYKVSNNIETADTTVVFGGDTYITSMRYANSIFWDNRVAWRKPKSQWWKFALELVLLAVTTILIFSSGGALAPLLVGALALLNGASIINQYIWQKVYMEEYKKGLKGTALDRYTSDEFRFGKWANSAPDNYSAVSPEDDEIEWLGDVLTNVWFESQLNMSLRVGMVEDSLQYFLDAPGYLEYGNEEREPAIKIGINNIFGLDITSNDVAVVSDDTILPKTTVDNYFAQKLTIFDSEREDSKKYILPPLPEYYKINDDYQRINKQKIYFCLPLEYDCCSKCKEKFPHRVHYSEQSFSEELTDNYRTFLPNNYRDIDGSTGEITDLFSIKNNLYIHTEDALWHLPQTYQERVTDQIVSFIGTGSYFSVPPRKIVDSDNNSAGTKHPIATKKTENGVFFFSENDRDVYLFSGDKLDSLKRIGLESWFNKHGKLKFYEDYYYVTGNKYDYVNNPVNPSGLGYLSTYDSKNKRFILTKKDYSLSNFNYSEDTYIISCNEGLIIFENYNQIIEEKRQEGYRYIGIEDCKMKFEREILEESTTTVEVSSVLPNDTDIHIFYDTSGSFDVTISGSRLLDPSDDLGPTLGSIDDAINDWISNLASQNPDWNGNIYKYIDSSERWLKFPELILSEVYNDDKPSDKNVLVISFVNEANSSYHGTSLNDTLGEDLNSDTNYFLYDYDRFTGSNYSGDNTDGECLYCLFKSFKGIHYPIVFPGYSQTTEFLTESLGALKGVSYTPTEINNISRNPGFTDDEWNILVTALTGSNPYPDEGLEVFNWTMKTDRYKKDDGTVIDSQQFQDDIEELLKGLQTTEEIEIPIYKSSLETIYVDGNIDNSLIDINNSFTISFSLKSKSWVSWHSYLPNFYYEFQDNFYSYINGQDIIWKHGVVGDYQSFYNTKYPHIIDYIDQTQEQRTKDFENIRLYTQAERYHTKEDYFTDERFITFNKFIAYNSRQSTGLQEIRNKEGLKYYMRNQVVNQKGFVLADKKDKEWRINQLRNYVVDNSKPLFITNIEQLQQQYFIDKILNEDVIDFNKKWSDVEKLRDKYLEVRLFFDNLDNVRLSTVFVIDKDYLQDEY